MIYWCYTISYSLIPNLPLIPNVHNKMWCNTKDISSAFLTEEHSMLLTKLLGECRVPSSESVPDSQFLPGWLFWNLIRTLLSEDTFTLCLNVLSNVCNNFTKCQPILKILSLLETTINCIKTIYNTSCHLLKTSLHYCVKHKNLKKSHPWQPTNGSIQSHQYLEERNIYMYL